MELREAEAFGVEYHHHGGVGHVHAHLYHCCGYEDVRLVAYELLHLFFLFGRFHLAVHLAYPEFGEHLAYRFITVFKVLKVGLLAFLYQREHHIHLPALVYLLSYAAV